MCNRDLKRLIGEVKGQNMQNFGLIYDEFKKLIFYYSKKTVTEDAFEELTVFFIEILYQIDLNKFKSDCSFSLQHYIAVCLRNKYIAISSNEKKQRALRTDFFEESIGYSLEFDKKIAVFSALKILPEKQREVLIYKYVYLYSDVEIAQILNTTRQTVNRIKNRALLTLKIFLGDN